MPLPDDTPAVFTRRRFLRLTVALSTMAVSLSLPLYGLRAEDGAGEEAVVAALGKAVPARKPRAPRLLVLDPGHGGRDPGAIGVSGTQEKDITLDIARRMADTLEGRRGLRVKLTRDEDEFMPLEDRVKVGQDTRADLFMSIHADSAPNASARGLSVYTLSEKASDAFSAHLADHENKADLMGGLDLPPADKDVTAILFDLAARRTRNTAQHARASFVKSVGRRWRLLERPMRAANFVVLRAPDVPSMLVETGFLSNRHDEQILRQPKQRANIARLMASDIAEILDSPLFG